MRTASLSMAAVIALIAVSGLAQTASEGPYRIQKTAKVGGEGGFDYVYADAEARRLYIPRSGTMPRVSVFDLDTLEPAGEISGTNARGAAVDTRFHHGFASSSPVVMWDTKTMKRIKEIPVDGRPDGILADGFNHRVYVFSHTQPNVTVIDARDGSVIGTMGLDGAPEQAVSDGKGRIYVDLEDKDSVAVINAETMKVTTTFSLMGKGGGNAGLALDARHHILFVACRNPQVMVMLDATNGKYLADLPIGRGCDGALFDPKTGECLSSQGDGTLTVIKEKSPTSFEVRQNLKTMPGGKTLTIDSKTGRIFVIAAEFTAPTNPPATGGRPARGTMTPGSFTILAIGK